jgi:glycosyltransferase involved in cell wall biosynthesis
LRIAFHVPRASYLGGGFSGDPILVRGLSAGLRARGHEVGVVSRLDANKVWRGRAPAGRLIPEAILVYGRMRRFSPDAWFVYMPSVNYPDLFGCWQRPRRYVLFAADSGTQARLPKRWRWLYAFAHRRSLARADKITVYRPRSADRLRSLGVPVERLCILPPAVELWDGLPSREDARRRLGLPQGAPVVLCVSRLTLRRKDGRPGKTEMILDLLAAVSALPPEVLLVVVGDGPGRQQLEKQVARLGLGARVRLTGSVPDVKVFYAACDVFGYPYGLDRPWVAVLEAQASARPAVSMRTDSAQLTVDDGRTGLLAKNLDDFREHLAALAGDRVRCEVMGRAARQYIAQTHSTEVRVKQIERLLLGRGDGQGPARTANL